MFGRNHKVPMMRDVVSKYINEELSNFQHS
jgi:hypothetical protein